MQYYYIIRVSFSENTAVLTALSTLGKGSVTVTITAVYVYTAEMFHTPVRHLAVGTSAAMARIGSMAAPFIGKPLVNQSWDTCTYSQLHQKFPISFATRYWLVPLLVSLTQCTEVEYSVNVGNPFDFSIKDMFHGDGYWPKQNQCVRTRWSDVLR